MTQNAKGKGPRRYGPNGRRIAREQASPTHPEHGDTTVDLGLGKPITNPERPTTWTYRIVHRTAGQKRAGRSVCATYADANDAASDILGEYFDQAAVSPEAMKLYLCYTVRWKCEDFPETADSHGGADGRDWR